MGAARGRHPRTTRPDQRPGLTGRRPVSHHRPVDRLDLPRVDRARLRLGSSRVGYDAVEVMVGIDALSQQIAAVRQLSDHHEMPISAIHAPCLLFTQRVWGTEPWGKLERSAEMAAEVGAEVVVVHPPFRWQKEYAAGFVDGHRRARGLDRDRLRRREHVPLAGGCPSPDGDVPARVGPLRRDLRQRDHRPVPRRGRAVGRDRDGRPARYAAAAHPPHRRHRVGQGRAPGPRSRRHRCRRLPPAPGRARLRRQHRPGDQHPPLRHRGRARARPGRVAGVRARALRGAPPP